MGLLVVADGMGGHRGGGIASQMAMGEVIDSMRRTEELRDLERRYHQGIGIWQWPYGYDRALSVNGNRLRTAIYSAHMRLLETTISDPSLAGMGTTIVAAVEWDGRLSVAWAGDSRLYVLREGVLWRPTRDDSWVEAATAHDPGPDVDALGRHALTNVVGSASRLDVHVVDAPVYPGDVVALTTDGVHGWLSDRVVARVLAGVGDPADAAADLVAAAIGCGSTDNCTAVVAHI